MGSVVSVIIPAYNAAETISATIQSAQRQTYHPLEIIVVDDGSKDATAEIVSEFQRQDDRVSLIRQENSGVAAARNRGLSAAHGSLIAPLDADDLWHPEKITRQVERLVQDKMEAGLVYSWSVEIDEQSRILRCDAEDHEGDVYAPLVLANFIGNSSAPLIRREVVEEIGGWDPSLHAARAQGCEDWILYLKIAERSRVVLAPGFLIGYRQLSGAMSRNIESMRRSYCLVMEQAKRAHPELPHTLFDRSEAEFELYINRMHRRSRGVRARLRSGLRLGLTDPWHSLKKVKSKILSLRQIRAGKMGTNFHGLNFFQLAPETRCGICESHDSQRAAFIESMPQVLGRGNVQQGHIRQHRPSFES
jgi:glycosyltransferase involved in cell wall biosynthesis